MKDRVEALDWLRGITAFSIMSYHLTSWLFGPRDASSILGKMGIYGVSIFFVISGLSMAIVYSGMIRDARTAAVFYTRRVFRIWPLLWVAVPLTVLFRHFEYGTPIDPLKMVGNMTTIIGFFQPGGYINTGAWSIGNEIVYYSITPLVLFAYNRSLRLGNAALALTVIIGSVFSTFLLDPGVELGKQFDAYINPLNNMFLYVAGIGIFYNLRGSRFRPSANAALGLAGVAVFALYPVHGNQILIVTGVNRAVFVLASLALVIAFYNFSWYDRVPKIAGRVLERIGVATYGVYLLHPVIFDYMGKIFPRLGIREKHWKLVLLEALTVAIAILSYELFEKRAIGLGKKLSAGFTEKGRTGPSTDGLAGIPKT